jgi:hypothetical protein
VRGRHDIYNLQRLLIAPCGIDKGPASDGRALFICGLSMRRGAGYVHRMAPALRALLMLFVACGFWVACTPLPDIAPLADRGGPPPVLVPLDNLLSSVDVPRATDTASDALAARAARLQERARLMRGPVLSPETRRRLALAIARGEA